MKLPCCLISLYVLAISTPAWPAVYGVLQPEQSRVSFVSKQMGVPVNGQFRRFSSQIAFDPARPEGARARIEIDLASVDAGSREANDEVVGKDWFFVKSFPVAVFEARRVIPLGGNRFEVTGNLAIKGRSKEVKAQVAFSETGEIGSLDAGFTLKRLDFGIGEGPWGDTGTVADEVLVKVSLTLKPEAAKPKK